MKLRTYDGVPVAELIGTTVVKRVKEKTHMLRTPPSWAFDKQIIDYAHANGATDIRIEATDTDKVYKTSIKNFIDNSFNVDRGFGRQVALLIKHWTTGSPEGKQLSLFMDN
tara:strand:+ start:536 stop:868 length:333 start_codon:yes stop_codon:yes gene_type:complete